MATDKPNHVPALDGLRGCALLGVLFFHADKALPGGYLGVDLFFVLSGYLITTLLVAEHARTGRISLGAFWIRRARRLFPALLALLFAVAAYAFFIARPEELTRIRGDALATIGYVANWRTIFSGKSYWEMFATPSPLEHTWSLAIEEQFYIAWPVLVMIVSRSKIRGHRRFGIAGLSIGLAIASIIAMLILYKPLDTGRVYLGTDTRASGILLGAALATIVRPGYARLSSKARTTLDVFGIASLAGLAIAWWRLDGHDRFLYRGGFWLTEIAACVLITCAVVRTPFVARILSVRPLTFIGTISYGLYLWHWPVNVLITSSERLSSWPMLTSVRFAVTFLFAIVSFYLLERPIRARGLPFGRPIYVVPSAVALVMLLIVGSTTRNARARVESSELVPTESSDEATTDLAPTLTNDEPPYKIMVFGDSTANSLSWTMRGVHRPNVVIEALGRDGCTMLYDGCEGAKWADQVATEKPNAAILIVAGAFEHEMEDSRGRVIQPCFTEWHAKFEKVVTQRLNDLVTPGTRVFIATVPLGLKWAGGPIIDKHIACINRSIHKFPTLVPGVTLVDLAERVCPKGKCIIQEEGARHPLRPDGVHYNIEGARELSSWLLDELGAPAPPSTN